VGDGVVTMSNLPTLGQKVPLSLLTSCPQSATDPFSSEDVKT
jgi:hypothetical protein